MNNNILESAPFWSFLASILIAQLLKPVVSLCSGDGWNPKLAFSNGGMPSSHTAAVSALSVSLGMTNGFASDIFVLSFVFLLIVMNDAINVRLETGKHSELLNEVVCNLFLYVQGLFKTESKDNGGSYYIASCLGNDCWNSYRNRYYYRILLMGKKKKENGAEKFELFYSSIYKERWEELKSALIANKENSISIPNLKSPYYLDIASFETANLLPIEEGMSVLDMCAAPGGKTLVLGGKLKGNGLLISNDKSPDRRERLRKVINECLDDSFSKIIKITGYDASSWGVYEKDMYNAILLDAPCSSERHVINSEKHLLQWSESRPKRLAIQQYAMLSSALLAVKDGGYILYSTCSINPNENEEVIRKLDKKHHGEFDEIDFSLNESEKLEYGRIILPDRASGKGPMYACLIQKRKYE